MLVAADIMLFFEFFPSYVFIKCAHK